MNQSSQSSKTNPLSGAKVTLHSPEQAEVAFKAQAAKAKTKPTQTTCTDSRGRVITVAEPDFLSQFRLTEALGASANNEAYMNMVRPLLYVKAIDDDPVSTPNTKREVEVLIQRLGEDGYTALAQVLLEQFVNKEGEQSTQEEQLKK